MQNITSIAFADGSSLAIAADGSTITSTDSSGVAKVYTATAPVVAPEDVEIDIILSNGETKKFVPA